MDQFRKLGIFDAIDRVTTASNFFEILTAQGQRIAMEEWPEKQAFNASTHFVHRGDFIDALLGVLPEGMVKLDHRLVRLTDNGSTATAIFHNGAEIEADLIVGADGIRSQVASRALAPGDALPSTRLLASRLGVSRGTVVAAYDQLIGEGYLRAEQGRPTTVHPGLERIHPSTPASLPGSAPSPSPGSPSSFSPAPRTSGFGEGPIPHPAPVERPDPHHFRRLAVRN